MAKINPELAQHLEANSTSLFNLIVRTNGDASPHLNWCQESGIEVMQQFRLSPGLAVTGSGAAALKLLEQDWVRSIELDKPVSTM